MTEHLNDLELMKSVSEGDRHAFSALYTRYLNNLYRYIYLICKSKETSEEIVQDVFLKIWEQRTRLDDVKCFKAYLFYTAKNHLMDHLRRQKVEDRVYDTLTLRLAENHLTSDSRTICNEYSFLIREAIDHLPKKRKEIVEMRTLEDLSLDEIADKLAISKSVVKKQLYRGMDFVRTYMHNQYHLLVLFFYYLVTRK